MPDVSKRWEKRNWVRWAFSEHIDPPRAGPERYGYLNDRGKEANYFYNHKFIYDMFMPWITETCLEHQPFRLIDLGSGEGLVPDFITFFRSASTSTEMTC